MRRKSVLVRNEIEARDCLIRTAVGRMLVAQYDLAEPFSERLAALLRSLDETDVVGADGVPPVGTPPVECDSSRTTCSARRHALPPSRN